MQRNQITILTFLQSEKLFRNKIHDRNSSFHNSLPVSKASFKCDKRGINSLKIYIDIKLQCFFIMAQRYCQ